MVLLRNVSGGLVLVGERYLFPSEARLVDEETAAAMLASKPGLVVASHPEHAGSRLELLPQVGGDEASPWPGDKPLLSSEEPHPSPPQIGEGAVDSVGGADGWLPDRLSAIRGIGPKVEAALNAAGVFTFQQLAEADAVALADALDGSSLAQVNRWIVQAQDLLAEES